MEINKIINNIYLQRSVHIMTELNAAQINKDNIDNIE